MPRYKLTLEYDGGPYHGFQAQGGLPSIQASIERAVDAFCGETVRCFTAGRTDAGVHATGAVAHIDLEKDWPAATVRNALNALLRPQPIVVLQADIEPAPCGRAARRKKKRRRSRPHRLRPRPRCRVKSPRRRRLLPRLHAGASGPARASEWTRWAR